MEDIEIMAHINKLLERVKERRSLRYDDPISKASQHGYIEALEEILEYIEDNE
jgi:hypothetical protein